MEKTIICVYWEKKTCKYMNNSSKCKFAHGVEEINVIDCIYGSNCYNINCKFNHGNESTIPAMVYDIPIIIKKGNKKSQKIKEKLKLSTIVEPILYENNINTMDIPKIQDGIQEKEIKTIKVINKEKHINDEIYIKNKDYNNLLSIIDDFYIKKYNNLKDKHEKKDKIINNLKDENNSLKNRINDLQNKSTISNMVDKDIIQNKCKKNNNIDKLKTLYNKYINIYELINKYNSYKLINFDEIRLYSKDKNIYKLKQRAEKVYKFYNKLKSGIINEYLPISKIFKMV